jgi:UDP-N-acetylmuramate--alanine ligase
VTRTSAEIGAGLAPAREAHPIRPAERIHVVGVGGAGASAAALLAQACGATVTGCDAGGPSPYTPAVEAAGVPVAWEHSAGHVVDAGRPVIDRLAVTKALTSIHPDHPELEAARGHQLPVEPWQQVVADAAATHGGTLVAVAGTHGKSTTTGWLVHLLAGAGRDPAAFVGALLPAAIAGGWSSTARWGSGDVFVVEADEYAGNFDAYRPAVAVLLNAEWDHPDVFPDEDAVLDAFEAWLRAVRAETRTLVANVGNPGVARIVTRLGDWPGRIVRAIPAWGDAGLPGSGPPDDPTVIGSLRDGGELSVALEGDRGERALIVSARLRLAGHHNAANALCVAAAAWTLGVPAEDIARGLSAFGGVGRRLELKGEPRGVTIVDDYAHHPTAIAASMQAVRERYPGRRVWAVYEPLTYHRTAAMLDDFAAVLAGADRTVIADIWAGRDPDTTITSAGALARAVTRLAAVPAMAPGSVEATADYLAGAVAEGDIVLVMGGGRSYVIAERLGERLASAEGQ